MSLDISSVDRLATMNDADAAAPSFEERVSPLMPLLLAYFQRRVEPREDAVDCVSEAVLVLWRQRERLPRSEQDLRAYSYGIARKVLANQRRGRLRQADLHERLRSPFTPEHSEPAAIDEARQLLDALKEKDRELVTLVVLDGLGVAEAGAVLGLRAGAARPRYARARGKLRDHLADTSDGLG